MKHLLKNAFILLLLLANYTYISAQETQPLSFTLQEAQEYALKNNRSIQSARIDIESAKKKVWETTAVGLPQINFATNYQHQFVIPQLDLGSYLDPTALPDGTITKDDILNAYKPSTPISLGVKNNATFDFTVSQLIFSGEYIVGLQASRVFMELSQKSLAKTENQTVETVSNTYYMILIVRENLAVLEQSLTLIDKTYNDLSKMNKEGFNEETDVDQIKINKSNIETLMNSLKSQDAILNNLLRLQLGVDFNQPIELTDKLSDIIDKCTLQYLNSSEFFLDKSVDMELMKTQVKLAELNLKREKSKFLPTISAFYRHEEQSNQPSFNFAIKDLLGATLTFPIFSSGMRMAQVSEAKLALKQSELAKADVEQSLSIGYEQAKSEYNTAFSNYNTNKESMELSKKIYERDIIKYTEGVSSSFELTQGQSQYLTAQSNYFNSVLSLLNSKAKLDRILKKYDQVQ